MRFVFWLCIFMLACGGAEPRTVAPPRPTPASNTGTFVDLAGGGRGYFVPGQGGGKHAALVVVHEWWGLNDWAKQQAERFASQGYDALAVVRPRDLAELAISTLARKVLSAAGVELPPKAAGR